MPAGFPAFPHTRFLNEKPPTLFHPSSPKSAPVSYSTSRSYTLTPSAPKQPMDTRSTSTPANDTSSLYTTTSTTSTTSLLKHPFSTLKTKLLHKEHSKKEETKSDFQTQRMTAPSYLLSNSSDKTPKRELAETYMIMAISK